MVGSGWVKREDGEEQLGDAKEKSSKGCQLGASCEWEGGVTMEEEEDEEEGSGDEEPKPRRGEEKRSEEEE